MQTLSNKYSLTKNECLPYIEFDNSYSFFNVVVSYLAGICSSSFVLYTYLSGGSLYTENHYIYFEGRKKATNKIYYLFPYKIFEPLLKNRWPESVKLYFKEKTFPDSIESESEIHGFKQVFLDLGQSTYIQFWENIKNRIISKYGNKQNVWPNIFKFGWIIRNALAHNFKIEINDSKIENISWNKLSYGYSNNGLDISEELMFIELIILMKDIEDELFKITPNNCLEITR